MAKDTKSAVDPFGKIPETAMPSDEPERSFGDKLSDFATGAAAAIPGAEALAGFLVGDRAGVAEVVQEARKSTAGTAGSIAGSVGLGVLAAPLAGGSAVASLGINAAQDAAAQVSDIAHLQNLEGSPFDVEQLLHKFNFAELAVAAVLPEAAGRLAGAAGKAVKGFFRSQAESSAAGIVAKTARKAKLPEQEVLTRVLDERLLQDKFKAESLRVAAGQRMNAAIKGLPEGSASLISEKLVPALIEPIETAANTPGMEGAARRLTKIQEYLLRPGASAETIQQLASDLKADARGLGKNAAVKRMFSEAAATIESSLEEAMQLTGPDAADAYRAARHDYRLYSNLAKSLPATFEAASMSDAAKVGTMAATGIAAGAAIGGPVGAAVAGAAAAGGGAVGYMSRTNKTDLFTRFMSRVDPEGISNVTGAVASVLNPSAGRALSSALTKPLDESFKEYMSVIDAFQADPQGAAENLRASLDFLPADAADGATAMQIQKMQALAQLAPKSLAPPTTLPNQPPVGITDRQKREFIRAAEAIHDPVGSYPTASPELRKLIEQTSPASVAKFREKLTEKLASGEFKPTYQVKQNLRGLLGEAATASQNPRVGGLLQGILQQEAQKATMQGQVKSARTQKALNKADKASLSRAQSMLSTED